MINEDEKIRGRGHCCSLVLSFAACGSDTASKDENVIHIMSSGDSSANMERALVDEYNKTADVKAVLDLVTSADYQNKLQTVMSNPKSDSAPDIFFNWADALMIQYARADVSAPLDEYMEKDPELKDNFLPSILDAAKVDGKYYGIPVRGVQPIVLFYNKKVLSDNGIEAPEYSNYDGTPHVDERDHWHFYSDAYRTAGNIGLDCLWNGVVPELCDANARLQRFFLEHDRTCVYAVDGTPVDETVLHPVGFIAATAEGSLAAMHSQEPDALDNAIRWVRLLWDTPIRTGTRRYYDNFLYAFAFLALAGEYRVW